MTQTLLEPIADMEEAAEAIPDPRSAADLLHDLGDIPLSRIRLVPPIGTATVADVERNKGCELIDGTLVEKAMGAKESYLASHINFLLQLFTNPRNLGMVFGEQGTLQVVSGLVRMADVAFVPWDRIPGRAPPEKPVPDLAPDLAVEVLSKGNTKREMARKRKEFFAAGTRLVWMVNPVSRTIDVYTSETDVRALTEADTLDGGPVLPGFTVPVRDVFAALDRRG